MSDRISNLPDEVTENIVSCLPLREATRTSVLSTKWRYKSAMLQDLVFDKDCLSTHKSSPTTVNVVDHVLLLHIGPLRKFELISLPLTPATDIDRWLNHLSRNSIKQLILDAWTTLIPYIIPSCLFSCQDMVHLELYGCLLYPPSTFRGFRALKHLKICSLTLSQVAVDNLICCSPLLEGLTMRHCDGFTNLKINAPNLRYIDILGDLIDFEVVNTSNLADASIDLDIKVNKIQGLESTSNLVKVLNHLPRIQRLTIKGNFLKYLSIGMGALPQKLSKPCQCLSVLSLDINLDEVDEVSTAICLLLSSPALQQLKISGREKIEGAVEKLQAIFFLRNFKLKACLDDNYKINLNQLRLVTITKISGIQAELDIIQILLSCSPVLEKLTIKPSVNCSSTLVKDLLRFRRLSISAEIIYLDP